jgi:poly(A) polymerase
VQLLAVILPELAPVISTAGSAAAPDRWRTTLRMLELLDDPSFELGLAALLHELAPGAAAGEAAIVAEQFCRRLKLSNDEGDAVSWLVGEGDGLHDAANWRRSRLKRLLAKPLIKDLIALERAHAIATDASLADVKFCDDYLRDDYLRAPADQINPPPLIDGDDLKQLGVVPGPRFKELLELVRDAQLDSLIATKEEALAYVRRILGLH